MKKKFRVGTKKTRRLASVRRAIAAGLLPADTTYTKLSSDQHSRLQRLEHVQKAIAAGVLPTDTTCIKMTKSQKKRLAESQAIAVTHAKPKRKLLELPRDIIKRILSLAYVNGEQIVAVSKMSERATRKIDEFLVSKAFCAAAAPAYVGDRVFNIKDFSVFRGIINSYATKVIITDALFMECWRTDHFIHVRNMEMQLANWSLQGWYTVDWRNAYTKGQIERNLLSMKCRETLAGLESFKVSSSRVEAVVGPSPHRDKTIDICRKNAQLFEQVISKAILRSRAPVVHDGLGGLESERAPIYPGSEVIFESQARET